MLNKTEDACTLSSFKGESVEVFWDNVYENKQVQNWHQEEAEEIMDFIKMVNPSPDSQILCAGVGDSKLVDILLKSGARSIIANDISPLALQKTETRIGSNSGVTFVEDNLVEPKHLQVYAGKIDFWIDRATLHFFTSCKDKDAYFHLLKESLAPNGYVILGVFNKDNIAKCCGLDLQLWSETSLVNRMKGFKLIAAENRIFREKNGNERKYIYTLFKKQ